MHGIYSYIKNNYSIEITARRKYLIKKHITALRESQDLVNVTGTGFKGHIKLVDKTRFIRNMNTPKRRRRLRIPTNEEMVNPIRRRNAAPSQHYELIPTQEYVVGEPLPPSQHYDLEEPVASSEDYEMRNQVQRNGNHQWGLNSPYDTPMVPNRASTPMPPDPALPFAPQRLRSRTNISAEGTPRISSVTRKRRLIHALQDE